MGAKLWNMLRRRKQIRLKEYDYALPGWYFVTVCSRDRIEMFGKVVDGKMICNECGNMVQSCWNEIPEHYRNIELDTFRVMPNHVHGIIIIHDDVGSRHASTLPRTTRPTLGNIIGSFKSAVTRRINQLRRDPGSSIWQDRFYDHIIRNQRSLDRIREYIRTNPERWQWDATNPNCEPADDSQRSRTEDDEEQ